MNLKRLFQRYSNSDLVLVYQSGKVGSTALAASLPGGLNVHDLYGYVMCRCGFEQRFSWWYRKLVFPVDRFLRRFMIKRRSSIDIIVPVRQPWERNVSMFFQDLPFWYVHYFATRKANQKVEGLELIKTIFEDTFDHQAADNWFQNEFCRFTGIEFDDIEFDVTKGHCILEHKNIRCLILTTDFLRSDLGTKAIEDFADCKLQIGEQNRGSKKWYGPIYQELLNDSEFIASYKEKMSTSLVQQKFFA